MSDRSFVEQIKVTGEELVENVERLIHEGNVRRIVIKQEHHTVAEFPLTIGVVGLLLAPILAAVGALAAVMTHCTIEVEREESVVEKTTEIHITPPEQIPHD